VSLVVAPQIDPRGRLLLPGLMLAVFTVSLMSTFGTPLVPLIARDLGVRLDAAQWSVTILLVIGAASSPIVGRFGDGSHRNRVLFAALAAMLVGCVVCATAASFAQLLFGRALQGIGYGIIPLVIGLARDHVDPARAGGAMATLSITGATGTGLGYPITGVVAELTDFRGAFWFGAAFAAVSLITVALLVPMAPASRRRVRPDLPGAVLAALGFGALLLSISRAPSWGWTSPAVLGLAVVGVLALVAWVHVERRAADPMIDLALITRPAVAAVNVVSLATNIAMFGSLVLVVLLAQTPASTGYGLGTSVATAGLLMLPFAAGVMGSRAVAALVSRRLSLRGVLASGALVIGATTLALALWHGALWPIAAAVLILGLGLGTTHAATPALIAAHVAPDRTSSAFGANQVARASGAATGSAISVTVLAAFTTGGSLYATATGYTAAFCVCSAVALLAAATSLRFVPARSRPAGSADGLAMRDAAC
jgi:predicted MFS family arabinose efflux permease